MATLTALHAPSISRGCPGIPGCTARMMALPQARRPLFSLRKAGMPARISQGPRSMRAQASSSTASGSFTPAIAPEDLPKGERKEVRINGTSILLLWYRDTIYALEARSPAEGAYSEGLIKAKLTQNYGIECPATGTVFSLKDGSILEWYPTNPVLRVLTPSNTCRPLRIFPVQLKEDAIYVDVSTGDSGPGWRAAKGGAEVPLADDVYTLQPKSYVQEEGDAGSRSDAWGSQVSKAAVVSVTALATLAVLVVGWALFRYLTGE
ncbi:PSB33 [Auxenochlorella protothecoides x Auxenochlorella symbiontica]